ncbi:MAG: hypothetical protein RL755_1535 [Pseudomonadota bacterium]|jgi:hypothetical protein
MINSHYHNNEVNHLEVESLFKKVQFYWNLNKLEEAHSVEPEMKHTECFEGSFEIEN